MKAISILLLLASVTVSAQTRIVPTYPGTSLRDFNRPSYVVERGEVYRETLGAPPPVYLDRSDYPGVYDNPVEIYCPGAYSGCVPEWGGTDIRVDFY